METNSNDSKEKRAHFMGLGGAGISAVAAFAKNQGFEISGCDLDPNSQFLKPLLKNKVSYFSEHNANHLEGIDILVVSPAIESLDPNNQELLSAKKMDIPIFIGEEFLAKFLIENKKVIAVSGTHGKSTTTAMIGKILEDAGLDPSVLVGAIVKDWGTNFRLGNGDYFVIEADEYREKFLLYRPYISIVTSVEMDHPEYFENLGAIKTAFKKFIASTKEDGFAVFGKNVTGDTKAKVIKFGRDFKLQKFKLKLIGEFNQVNATLALEVAKLIEIDKAKAIKALEQFSGISRRFEFFGEEKGIKIFDDYGHHPTAILATSQAARDKFPNQKIWLVYQPHMFSRTKYLFNDFVNVFKNLPVEEIILVDIFAARQENNEKISSRDIVLGVKKDNVRYIRDFEKTSDYLTANLNSSDIVIVMGAGDIYKLSKILLAKLARKS